MITIHGRQDEGINLNEYVIEKMDREIKLLEDALNTYEKTTFRGTIFGNVKQIFEHQINLITFARDAISDLNNVSYDILIGVIIGEHGKDLDKDALESYGYPGYPVEDKEEETHDV